MLRRRLAATTSRNSCSGIRQAGTPEVVATGSHDARAKTYRLDIAQTVPPTPGQPSKEPMVIPLAVGLVGRDGRDLPLVLADGRTIERGVLTLNKPAESFVFGGIAEPPVPSLNRGFSAPIKLIANVAADDLRFLAARDTDPFNRWQAVQTLATRLLVDNAAALRAEKPRTPGRRPRRRARRGAGRRHARAGFRRAHAVAAGRGRHRARDRPRRRSRRDLRGALGIAKNARRAARRAAVRPLPPALRKRTLPPRCRERRPARIAQHLPRSPGGDPAAGCDRARRAAVSVRPTT